MEFLVKISRLFAPGGELKEILPGILEELTSSLKIDRGFITIFNRKSSEIEVSVARGITSEQQARGKYQLGEGITGRVVETGVPVVIPDMENHPHFLNRTGWEGQIGKKGFICVPVKTTNEVIGAIGADKIYDDPEELDEDLKVLQIIAPMISRAVRLYQAIHEEQQILQEENLNLHRRLEEKFHPRNIIGNSGVMRDVYDMINKIAPTSTSVLILGESGVGKELVAQAIHYTSPRASEPFITFNCAALPESLIESELFGHAKGSFTGAHESKAGKFQAAHGGTIFLDEVGELSQTAQSKLLRVLQEKEFEQIGSNEVIKVDVRVIAATNRDLLKQVEQGRFRLDLYYRLNVFPITVPPLRERKTDIPLLVDGFIEKYSAMNKKNVKRISTPAIDMIMAYHWPGNVRELENCIERAVILADHDVIHGYNMPPSLQTVETIDSGNHGKLQKQLDLLEYEIIVEELKRSRGKLGAVAKNLGITYRQVGLRVSKYRIDVNRFKR
jgi:Nif-specific regulatory protein